MQTSPVPARGVRRQHFPACAGDLDVRREKVSVALTHCLVEWRVSARPEIGPVKFGPFSFLSFLSFGRFCSHGMNDAASEPLRARFVGVVDFASDSDPRRAYLQLPPLAEGVDANIQFRGSFAFEGVPRNFLLQLAV
jgi:hypothetical protein